MNSIIYPKPGDMLEENCLKTDFKARYIVLSILRDKHEESRGVSYKLYTLYVESSHEFDLSLQGTIDIAYNLEINSPRQEWSIIS